MRWSVTRPCGKLYVRMRSERSPVPTWLLRSAAWALAIDLIVIQTIAPAASGLVRLSPADIKAINADPTATPLKHFFANVATDQSAINAGADSGALLFAFALYVIVLVALVGQTFGMMVSDVRVVGADHRARIGFRRAIARYVSLAISLCAVVGWFSLFARIQPFEKWSKTRLVSGGVPVRS